MSNSSGTNVVPASGDTDALWIAGGVGLCGVAVWGSRDSWYAKLAPYGLTAQDTEARPVDPWSGATRLVGTGHYHLSALGWLTIVIGLAGLVAALWCVAAGVNVGRWHASHGTRAVPQIPVPAAAVVAAVAVFAIMLALTGRHRVLFMAVGPFLAAAAFFAVMVYASMPAWQWRQTQAFAGQADQVLGHGHPGTRRVRATAWAVSQDGSRRWPGRVVARTGPGWQHKPAETAQMNRYARQFGWPPYDWTYDPMYKRVVGVADAAKAER